MGTKPDGEAKRAKAVRRRGGRQPILDDRKKAEICAIVAMGCLRNRAAAYVGCATSTIWATARRDPAFAAELRKAEAQLEIHLLRKVQDAANDKNGWRVAVWLLERRFPDRYGTRRAGTMTPAQVATVLAQFGEILSRGIRDVEDRSKVGEELDRLTSALAGDAEKEPRL